MTDNSKLQLAKEALESCKANQGFNNDEMWFDFDKVQKALAQLNAPDDEPSGGDIDFEDAFTVAVHSFNTRWSSPLTPTGEEAFKLVLKDFLSAMQPTPVKQGASLKNELRGDK